MSGRPFKYTNNEDRIKAAKEQRRASYERNKDKYKARANLRAKRSYYRKKLNDAIEKKDDTTKEYYMKLLLCINEQLEEDSKKET